MRKFGPNYSMTRHAPREKGGAKGALVGGSQGAASGAALGAKAAGPKGAVVGGTLGGLYGLVQGGRSKREPSDEEVASSLLGSAASIANTASTPEEEPKEEKPKEPKEAKPKEVKKSTKEKAAKARVSMLVRKKNQYNA